MEEWWSSSQQSCTDFGWSVAAVSKHLTKTFNASWSFNLSPICSFPLEMICSFGMHVGKYPHFTSICCIVDVWLSQYNNTCQRNILFVSLIIIIIIIYPRTSHFVFFSQIPAEQRLMLLSTHSCERPRPCCCRVTAARFRVPMTAKSGNLLDGAGTSDFRWLVLIWWQDNWSTCLQPCTAWCAWRIHHRLLMFTWCVWKLNSCLHIGSSQGN